MTMTGWMGNVVSSWDSVSRKHIWLSENTSSFTQIFIRNQSNILVIMSLNAIFSNFQSSGEKRDSTYWSLQTMTTVTSYSFGNLAPSPITGTAKINTKVLACEFFNN